MSGRPLRIVIFSDCYIPRVNGVVTSVYSQKLCLERLGHQVQLVVPRYPDHYHVKAPEWAQPSIVERGVLRLLSNSMKRWPDDRFSWPWPAVPLWKIMRTNWDIIHLHTPFNIALLGVFTAWMKKIPLVFTHHTQWEEYSHYIPYVTPTQGRQIAKSICDYYFRRSQLIICPSEEIRQALYLRDPKLNTAVVPTGIEAELFQNGDPQQALKILGLCGPGQTCEIPPIFLYVGRLGPEKSVDFLLHCHRRLLEKVPNARLVIVGGGPGLEDLQRQALQMGIGPNCNFTGWQPRSQLRHFFAAARAFVFASQTETQGLVLLEAAAAGVPVLAVRASGVNEAVMDGKTGILVAKDDIGSFVGHLGRLALEPELVRSFASAAQAQAKANSDLHSAQRMLEEYHKILSPLPGAL